MIGFNLTGVAMALRDARAALLEAQRCIERELEEMTPGAAEEQEQCAVQILNENEDVRILYTTIQQVRQVIGEDLWMAELKARLREEEDWANHEEELVDMGSY